MQDKAGHPIAHQHSAQFWGSQRSGFLSSPLQHHAGSPAMALPCHASAITPAYLPSSRIISAARETLARCAPEQVFHYLRPFADRLRMQGWTLLLADCGKIREHQKALAVFQVIPQKNVWHHSALIAALGACGQWEQALQHLEQLKQLALQDSSLQPNHVTYSAALAACARVQRLDRVLQLFNEMEEKGIVPDSVTYYIVQSSAIRVCDWQLVDSMLQAMHSKGMPARPMVYAAYIKQLCRNKQWNQALGIFLVMQDLGIPATSAMITELLRTFNLCGKHRMAVLLLQEAETAGFVKSAAMYDSVLRALLDAGHLQTAAELCTFMQNSGRWQPTAQFLERLQECSTAAGEVAAAADTVCLQDSGAGDHAATVAAGQAENACVSNSNISPQSSSAVDLEEVVSDCLEQCKVAVCYFPAAACSTESDTETDDYISNTSSTEVSSVAASSSMAAFAVHSPLAASDIACSTSASCGRAVASPAAGHHQTVRLESSSGDANCQELPDPAHQRQVHGKYNSSVGCNRPCNARQSYQRFDVGYSAQYSACHAQHHRQQYYALHQLPQQHQQQVSPASGHHNNYYIARHGTYTLCQHTGPNNAAQQHQQA